VRAIAFAALGLAGSLVGAGAGGPVNAFRSQATSSPDRITAARDPAWSAAGTEMALSILDQIHILPRDSSRARVLVEWPADARRRVERDPAWSPDGRSIVFAADAGDGYDLFLVDAAGGKPRRLTSLAGDERWPSWTRDNRIVFAARPDGRWDLYRLGTAPSSGQSDAPERLTETPFDETEPSVSPDGRRVVYVSPGEASDGEIELWTVELAHRIEAEGGKLTTRRPRPIRLTTARGPEWSPAWSPSGDRVAYAAMRESVGSIWVSPVAPLPDAEPSEVPAGGPVLVSRHAGEVAWSPDGRTLLVAGTPDRDPGYNGQPLRSSVESEPLFANGTAYTVRLIPAPLPPDAGATPVTAKLPSIGPRLGLSFDRVWNLLDRLYYHDGASAQAWRALGDRFRPQAALARTEDALETVIDAMLAQQPLIREPVRSTRALVVSGHPLASQAGADILARGGNVVDAAIATSFALGVVEPDASGIGGDGMALVLLQGMREPVVIDFKDQAPVHATLDNPALLRDGQLVGSGPAAANIPGVVAGLDVMYRRFGSKRVAWSDLVAPAIRHAEEGYVLDESLPTTVAESRAAFAEHEATREIFLPGGRVPRAGDRFVNRDYGTTLRSIASGGATEFYQGEIARRIARDMSERGGIIRYEDLAQYRAIERAPVRGRFRGLEVFSTPPPVASGTSLVEWLQVVDQFKTVENATRADRLHVMIEAWKVVHPLTRVADPALWPVDVSEHLDAKHAAALSASIDLSKASRTRRAPADPDERTGTATDGGRLGRGTSAFAVADAHGNVVVVTQTLSTWGGSFYVSKGLGFLYNNHLRLGRMRRGAFGQLLPLARSSSTNASTIVVEDDGGVLQPRLAVAAAGNAWILPSIATIIAGAVDERLSAQAAVEAPRLLVGRDPTDPSGESSRIQIEDRFPRSVIEDLSRRGHRFQTIGRKGELRYGYASVIRLDGPGSRLEAGADPRRSHRAAAVP
jgi:gamma-glutamyltranspeptidase